jgi:serine protease AprX
MSCDDFALTVTLPTPLIKSQKIQIDLAYDPASSPVDDMDLRLLDKDGNAIGSSANAPGVVEQITISAEPGTSQYTVQVVPYAVTGTRGTVTAQVLTPSDSPTPGADPCAQSGTATASVIVAPSVRQALQTLGSGASYGAFVHFSMGSQAEHTALFQKLGLSVVKSFYPYANSIFVRGPVAGFLKLLDERSVSYVEANEKLHYTAEADVWSTRARVAQEPVSGGPYYDASGHVLDGTGVTISVVDSGLFGAHPDFAGRILHNYVIEGSDAAATTPPIDVGYTNSDTTGGHGTHCNGIAAGGGEASDPNYPVASVAPNIPGVYTGVAPKANLWAYGVGQTLAVLAPDAAFKDILDQYDPKDPKRIRVISNSYGGAEGGSYNPADTTSCLVKSLIAKNISVVYAAANNGPGDGSSDQTTSTCKDPTPGVICVASYDDEHSGTVKGNLSSFSSRGKKGDQTTYPDITAPGSNITATCLQAAPGQAVCATGAETKWQPNYGTISGTSMATPHVAGAIALLYQAKPDLTPAQVEKLIQDTARKVGGEPYEPDSQNPGGTVNYGFGAGLLDIPAALDALGAKKAGLPSPGVEFTVFDGDTDTLIADAAADVTKLTMTETVPGETPSGVTFRLTVADAAGFNIASTITYTIHMSVAGVPLATSVSYDGSKLTIPEAGTGNTAIATKAGINGNVISLFVPYSNLAYPPVGSPIHNIRVSSEDDNGTLEDWAPSPMGLNVNAPGAAQAGNSSLDKYPVYGRAFTTLQSPGVAPASTEKSCAIPGLTQLTSPLGGDATGGANLPTGQDDLRQAWISEPADMPGKIVFTIKVTSLSFVPPAYRWYMYFTLPETKTNYFVAMDGSNPTPKFIYGTRSSTADTTGDLPEVGGFGLFATLGSLDAASQYTADGTITLVLDKSLLKITDGMQLTGVAASIRQTTNSTNGIGLTVDSAAASGPYTVVGNTCKTVVTPTDPGTVVPVTPTPVIGGVSVRGRFGGGAIALGLLVPMLAMGGLRRRRARPGR